MTLRPVCAALAVLVTLGCGRPQLEPPTPSRREVGPGWSGGARTVAAPLGAIEVERVDGWRLEGRVALSSPAANAFFLLAMQWDGVQAPQVLTRVAAVDDQPFSVELDPPADATFEPIADGRTFPIDAGTCAQRRATGRLLVYAVDGAADPAVLPNASALVGLSIVRDSRFPFVRQSGFRLGFPSCQASQSYFLAVSVESEPWFGLSVCADAQGASGCGLDASPPVQLGRMEADVGFGQVSIRFTPLIQRAGEAPTLEVNGVVVPEKYGAWVLPADVVTLAPMAIAVRMGNRAPWTGLLQLPPSDVQMQLTPAQLEVGAPFELSWKNDGWATARAVSMSPQPPRKVGSLEFAAEAGRARGTYAGWNSMHQHVDAVSVYLRLARADQGCTLTQATILEASAARQSR